MHERLQFKYPRNKITCSPAALVSSKAFWPVIQLQQDNPKTAHIWLQCQLTSCGTLRCTVSIGAHDMCGDMTVIPNRSKSDQATIRQLGMEPFIHKNVWGPVSLVYHRWACLVMQVLQPSYCPCSNLHPCVPIQSLLVWQQICMQKHNIQNKCTSPFSPSNTMPQPLLQLPVKALILAPLELVIWTLGSIFWLKSSLHACWQRVEWCKLGCTTYLNTWKRRKLATTAHIAAAKDLIVNPTELE